MRAAAQRIEQDRSEAEPLLVSFQTACQRLSISPATGYRLIASGALDSVKVLGSRRVKLSSIKALAENGTRQAA
jgi:excisionase family DNA binding protein